MAIYSDRTKRITAVATFLAAIVMWYLMFVVKPFNFWYMMTGTTSVMILISFTVGNPVFLRSELNGRNFAIGIVSAAGLYAIFWIGNAVVHSIMPGQAGQIQAIYGTKSELDPAVIAFLLFFPIGAGEEIYWRGFLQKYLDTKMSRRLSLFLVLAGYTAVHLSSGNPILILAAFVCGLYWGLLYYLTRSAVPGIISHMLWDPFIFVFFPVM